MHGGETFALPPDTRKILPLWLNIAYRHAPVPCATHREAGSNGRLRMKASIDDVAAKAGVSTATVSRAFSHPEKVSPKTRDKVLKAAEQLDFSISRSAGVLKSGKSYRIALLVGNSRICYMLPSGFDSGPLLFQAQGDRDISPRRYFHYRF